MTDNMTIGQVASATGISARTVRFYEKKELVPEPERSGNGYRIYTKNSLDRLVFISRARQLNLSLSEIKTVLDLRDSDRCPCTNVEMMITNKIAELEASIAAATCLRDDLLSLKKRHETSSARPEQDGVICQIIERG